MDFEFDAKTEEFRERLLALMDEKIYPAEAVFQEQLAELDHHWAWTRVLVLNELGEDARTRSVEPRPSRQAGRRPDQPAVRTPRRDHRSQRPPRTRGTELCGA
jgi:hypothetical protein